MAIHTVMHTVINTEPKRREVMVAIQPMGMVNRMVPAMRSLMLKQMRMVMDMRKLVKRLMLRSIPIRTRNLLTS
jgi:hypothetical protein